MKYRRFITKAVCTAAAILMAVNSISTYAAPAVSAQALDTAWTMVNNVYVNPSGEPIPGAVLKGIDVSYHNKDIDWAAVQASDIDYAIIRCGYGQDFESQDDIKWRENADACTAFGIPFGTYLYSYATTVSAAKSEAEHVLRLLQGYQLTYPVYYDMEDKKQADLSARRKAQIAEVFCSTIEAAGYEVGIYANTNWFTTKLTDEYFDTRDKWVAQYNDTCTYTGSYRMWQCTSSGTVPGITTKVDLNFWFDMPPVYQGNTGIQITPATGGGISTDSAIGTENLPGTENITGTGSAIGTGTVPGTDHTTGADSLPETEKTPENNESSETGESSEDNGKKDDGSDQTSREEQSPDNQPETDKTTGEQNDSEQNHGKPSEENKDKSTEADTSSGSKKLTLSHEELTLSYNETLVLTASKKVTWSSSDKTIVKIGSKGKVKPLAAGQAIITATTSAGKTAQCIVTVTKPIADTVIAQIPSQQFIGEQIRPEPVITDGEKTLTKGTDYKLTYTNNMAKGTATIKIKGKGLYTGKTTVSFEIVAPAKLAAVSVNSIIAQNAVIHIKWNKIEESTGYEIYRATKKKGAYKLKKTILKNSKVTYKDKKLKVGKKYYYKIRAYQITDEGTRYSKYCKVTVTAG